MGKRYSGRPPRGSRHCRCIVVPCRRTGPDAGERPRPRAGGRSDIVRTSPQTVSDGTAESKMIRFGSIPYVLAVTVAGALGASAALAQGNDGDDSRYQFNRVEDGYLRVHPKAGPG